MAKSATSSPRNRSSRSGDLLELAIGVGIVCVVLFIGSFLRVRADLTNEQRFTLTPATREMVEELPDIVYVKVYLTGGLPADLQRLSQAAKDLLDEMRAYQPDKIQYSFIDPNASTDEKTRKQIYDQLQEQGLTYSSIRLQEAGAYSERIIFPGALVTYRDKTVPVQLLKTQLRAPDAEIVNRSLNNLEYEMASAFRQAITLKKPRIAFLEGQGELSGMQIADMTNLLKEQYDVSTVRIDEKLDALSIRPEKMNFRVNNYDALIIAKPDSTFAGRDRYVIDQFIMNGGKVLWLIDAMNANLDSLRTNQVSMARPYDLDLDDQLFAYGVRLNKDLLLDRNCAPIEIYTQPYGNQRKLERFPWYFEPVIIPTSGHPIVSNLDPIHLRFVGSLDTIATDNVKKTILLSTSAYTRMLRNPVRVSLGVVEADMGFDRTTTPYLPVAVLLEGNFTSAFVDLLPKEFTDDPTVGYREQGARTAQIVISDGNVIENRIDPAKEMFYMLGFDRYANSKIYGNRELLINCMNYLLDDKALISIRSRAIALRQLDPQRVAMERSFWQIIAVALPILISILAGIAYHLYRRRRSTFTA
ncbi:MAG: gliding motility-associated ABC transporter substrate-binding protein GldG [Flavobacteriales bacterium]|nr:gliding motility-associated ABC transporter substrate-binding protein GldG [Flavobacteriales bacterium]MBK6944998.1 gliding motility-associated ABC transporter substrate-binding protein GldG [Flavobacteriales bacterium]HQV51377.1 gliding motility-associated ABC transporter substrate-binding protein GldG [Flavobacteriales bacterium]HQX31664.1 gliding motility-associated ABC transporter substrate-binding protein GldG [Flavobacteriales bacterium]HQX37709.1 gliding motility-associated ABC transp